MLHRLKRHPIEMAATLAHSVVVGYAFPRDVLDRLLPPGLLLDTFAGGELGLAAVAMVEARRMRPAALPASLGRDYRLVGYRVFCRFRTPEGRLLRGLHILRSDADGRAMVTLGNALTHYGYRRSRIAMEVGDSALRFAVASADGEGDLDVTARIGRAAEAPPAGSPFADLREARRFAGPLPFTFDFEPESGSIVVIEGVRSGWSPTPVDVEVRTASFFGGSPFAGATPVLANAFHIADVPYRWRRGRVYPSTSAA